MPIQIEGPRTRPSEDERRAARLYQAIADEIGELSLSEMLAVKRRDPWPDLPASVADAFRRVAARI